MLIVLCTAQNLAPSPWQALCRKEHILCSPRAPFWQQLSGFHRAVTAEASVC